MEKQKFIIHIGGQKCGSSAIQGYLYFNRFNLLKKGLIYLDEDFGIDQNKCCSHNHMLSKVRNETLDSLDKKFYLLSKLAKNKTCIFTSEGLCTISHLKEYARKFSLLKKYFDVKIIFYIRNQVEVHYSGWQQWGIQQDLNFKEWCNQAILDNRANWGIVAKVWLEYFDKESFITKVYHLNNLKNKDIVGDFIDISGIPYVESRISNKANYSFSDAAIISIMKVVKNKNLNLSEVISFLKKTPPTFLKGKKENLVLTSELANSISEYYKPYNIELIKKFDFTKGSFELLHTPTIKEYQTSSNINIDILEKELEYFIDNNFTKGDK